MMVWNACSVSTEQIPTCNLTHLKKYSIVIRQEPAKLQAVQRVTKIQT